MLSYILLIVGLVLVGILLYAATRPGTVRYERSTTINAAPERILPRLIDFHEWSAWSPWEKLDPGMARSFSGAPKGTGAKYAWDSKERSAGAGSMEITATSATRVDIDLRFIRPFKNECVVTFDLVPQGTTTRIDWTMVGPSPYLSKLMGLFMDFDKMVGKDFEKGLADIKRITEQ